MTNKNTDGDNWGQLLSDFGIKDQAPKEAVPSEDLKTPKSDSQTEDADDPSQPKEKKSIFSRFPKINNFFGVPPQASLDSVIEGTKSPSLGGKTFTDNKLEKMPLSQERKDRHEKKLADDSDAWSTVASQIDVLASGGEPETKSKGHPTRRRTSSMFDDPIPVSDEARALKDLMGEQAIQQEVKRRGDFLEEAPGSRQRGRGRRQSQPEEREGRGSRYKPPVEVDDLPEADFEPIDDDMPVARGRGRRGSKYDGGGRRDREQVQNDVPQEEWSEIDAALQADRGGSPRRAERYPRHERSERNERNDKRRRSERSERPAADMDISDGDDGSVAVIHGDIPSWDEAIGDIVSGNIARHKNSSSNRGRR